jgi:hypothetical protein
MNSDNVYIAYIKKTFLNGRQEIEDYQFNFNTNRILSVDGSSDIIIPDSINEKIYNAAYNLYIKNNK